MPAPRDPEILLRTVVVNMAFVGDVLLSAQLVSVLKRCGAQHVAMVVTPAAATAAAGIDGVDDVIPFDKRAAHRGMAGAWQFGTALRRSHFTTALVPHRSLRSAILARASDIPVRIGFRSSAGRMLLSHTTAYRSSYPETHRNLSLLVPLVGSEILTSVPWFSPPKNPGAEIPTVVMAPGSQWATKRWPAIRFAELAHRCLSHGWNVVVTGSEAERTLCEDVAHGAGPSVALHVGEPFDAFRARIAAASALVANDTAAVHVANAVGTPVVAIFGPTVPEFGFAPRGVVDSVVETHGLICRPCDMHGPAHCPVGTHACMTGISVDAVFHAVLRILRAVHDPRHTH